MLRLIPSSNPDGTVVLKLEGKLFAPWIDELHRTIANLAAANTAIHLDLSDLSYVDTAGSQALSELIERGAFVTAASGFIATMLKREAP